MAEPCLEPAEDAAARPKAPPPANTGSPRLSGQYFEARPRASHRPRSLAVNVGGLLLRCATDSGVFSPDRLDAGTRLLLLEAPPLAADELRVLDLGCGWGAVACVAGLRSPGACVLAVDVNERALRLTAQNAAANGAANVTVARPGEVDPAMSFHRILCNPPVRVGKAALRELLSVWLDRLAPGGRAHLVVHRHLGSDSLARWLAARGHGVTRLVSRAGYRLMEVSARRAPADDPRGAAPASEPRAPAEEAHSPAPGGAHGPAGREEPA